MFLHQLLSEKNNLGQGNATSEPGTVRLRCKYRQNTGLSTKQGASSEPRARGVEFTDAAHFTGEDFESIHFSGDKEWFFKPPLRNVCFLLLSSSVLLQKS